MAICLTSLRNLRAVRLPSLIPSSSSLIRPTTPLSTPVLARSRSSAMEERTYESALRHLDSIQSNRHVTSLFTSPPPAPSSSTASDAKPSAQDLNAQAIPEMLAWLARAGLTQADVAARLRCVHVAGTKGKGSVCAYLTAILATGPAAPAAGRVGTYTSPHLVSVRERIQLDGRPISRALFARYFFEVWDALTEAARAEARTSGSETSISEDELRGPATKPFYFRFLTILALHAFAREGVRSAVIECGIGGEFDSTNVLPPAAVSAAVVARLGVDHVGMLGATVPEIAWHKAGVCKPGRACFTLQPADADADETLRVLRTRAAEKGARLVVVDDARLAAWPGVPRDGAATTLDGDFQKSNQALALLAASEHLRVLAAEEGSGGLAAGEQKEESLEELGARFGEGLRQARLRGRCETLEDGGGGVTWFADGAHTADSLVEAGRWYARKLARLGGTPVLLFNQQERDVANLLASLDGGVKREPGTRGFATAVFTRNDLRPASSGEPGRDLAVQRTAADFLGKESPQTKTVVTDNVSVAVDKIRAMQREDGGKFAVLATGSLHLVGALLRTLEPDGEL
ncbi:FolC bifunctional protein [Hypoxylon sp. FL1284]|nr:FolC bifunctional protein [Hypoxylon sp. FL1284]